MNSSKQASKCTLCSPSDESGDDDERMRNARERKLLAREPLSFKVKEDMEKTKFNIFKGFSFNFLFAPEGRFFAAARDYFFLPPTFVSFAHDSG
jgi:hypothetical protein